ncbi:MAG: aromatic ring-hydroxylating dioxygenase subunit alpha [Fimbriimonadaceae bacterium]|nr:aromatic ring-hydroxylating dioxygenase subunit alpha [Chthonomonadaceae bacterium]MCO5295903.1 aromatic ring-hydroxylating dioxygenase subunit alpha [Fimbriimonadaceae bacterium]
MSWTFAIDADIAKASTPPAAFYKDPEAFAACRELVFARSWQFLGDTDLVRVPGQIHPFTLLEGCLDEPLLLTRDRDDALHCLSNVCTHRGNLVAECPGHEKFLRCRYHGRRFGLDGCFQSMPSFEGVEGFPSEADHLPKVPFGTWRRLLFASLDPAQTLEALLAPVEARVGFLPIDRATFEPSRAKEYAMRAHWALYVDNYLEAFHIPFIHPGLSQSLDVSQYRTECFDTCNLQVGVAADGEPAFELPAGHPDEGQRIAAYYFWLFPNTMVNVYPWGISMNVVRPLGPDRTRVSFLPYVWDPSLLDQGAGGDLDRVEREDESVVEATQRGLRSRLYHRGRYSPTQEVGTHHFHSLLAKALSG